MALGAADLLGHLLVCRDTGAALPGYILAVGLGHLLAVLLGCRGTGLSWSLHCHLLAVLLGHTGAFLYLLLDWDTGTTLLGNP